MRRARHFTIRLSMLLIAVLLIQALAFGTPAKRKRVRRPAAAAKPAASAQQKKQVRPSATSRRRAPRKRSVSRSPWKTPTYSDPTQGDIIDGDDIAVRRAAVEALGRYNGSVVVTDPETGRILTIVNQNLALRTGFQPCSTIKLVTALAALGDGLIQGDTPLRLARSFHLNLTGALAKSNNPYFAQLGMKLGFERVSYYARLFGLGERAGLDVDSEEPGVLPQEPPPGGVGMMTSFGEGISMTPLELSALVSAISNGGTLYYLQYPRSQRELADFVPQVKRELDIWPWIPDVKVGMRAAVDFGTARRARYGANEPILGKTGTCTDYRAGAHMGWFGSFNDVEKNKLVVVVMLTGGKPVNGPVAAGIAGQIYKQLSHQNYFASSGANSGEMFATASCCAR